MSNVDYSIDMISFHYSLLCVADSQCNLLLHGVPSLITMSLQSVYEYRCCKHQQYQTKHTNQFSLEIVLFSLCNFSTIFDDANSSKSNTMHRLHQCYLWLYHREWILHIVISFYSNFVHELIARLFLAFKASYLLLFNKKKRIDENIFKLSCQQIIGSK